MIHLANPWGLLALVALPAIVAIHLLQRRSRRVVTSTLFLLDPLAPESLAGRRIERLRNSLPLWLQLLAALLLAVALSQPRILRRESWQEVAFVLDASASMAAFETEAREAVRAAAARLERAAGRTEWSLLESDPLLPIRYSGASRAGLEAALAGWKPRSGAHDPTRALGLARSRTGPTGVVILVTDRNRETSAGTHLLAVGTPLANVGFTGLTTPGSGQWSVLVRNFAREPQTRSWWIETDGATTPPQPLALDPGASLVLRGNFTSDRMTLRLDPDRFALDDALPLVRPRPKPLRVARSHPSALFERFAESLPDRITNLPADRSDLLFLIDGSPPPPAARGAVSAPVSRGESARTPAAVVAEEDPLLRDLVWTGLQYQPPDPPIAADDASRVLLWDRERPLLSLSAAHGAPLLRFHFDPDRSNAARLPSFVILLHRFAERTRAATLLPSAANFETGQPLGLPSDARDLVLEPAPEPVTPGTRPATAELRAPRDPGFLRVLQAGEPLLEGAAHFADGREADFAGAETLDPIPGLAAAQRERHSEQPLLPELWLMLAGIGMTAAWGIRERGA